MALLHQYTYRMLAMLSPAARHPGRKRCRTWIMLIKPSNI